MKKLSVSLAVMGMASLGFAQNSYPKFESKFLDMGLLNSNYAYLSQVQNELTPNQAKYLENVVSYWDVTRSEEFAGLKKEPFEVTFRAGRGYIVASYDDMGKILTAEERFKNVTLPKQLQISIAKQYPNWSIVKNTYSLRYAKDKKPKKHLMVLMKKGNLKKRLKIDLSGQLS